jgi:taurine transport system ATP-binding protein
MCTVGWKGLTQNRGGGAREAASKIVSTCLKQGCAVGLELKDVAIRFATKSGPVEAIADVSLSIKDGEFVSVVGPSGCGKTTLLNIIAGFLKPTWGSVLLDGEPILGPGADRAVIFQHPVALLPWLNVADNVALGLRLGRTSRKSKQAMDKLVESSLRTVGLWGFRDRAIYELSGGMQQRVALCRVLVTESRMLLMDEPFGALDALTREKMQEELFRITRETGKTVFFITHSVDEAIFLGTSVVVMSPRPGRIIRTFDVALGNGPDRGDSRAVKGEPAFVDLRDEILKLIWKEV